MKPIHSSGSLSAIIVINSIIPEWATGGNQINLHIVQELNHEDEQYYPNYYKGSLLWSWGTGVCLSLNAEGVHFTYQGHYPKNKENNWEDNGVQGCN